jgi:hypothetical protein
MFRGARWYSIHAYQKYQFGYILEGLGIIMLVFYGSLVNFREVWYIIRPLGIFMAFC